ncbi:MAG: shikimate dehydrogenase [Gammaproteobacteria bacterium]
MPATFALEGFKPLVSAAFCCVVGSPIAHSRSPLIHRLFAEQFNLKLQYEKFEVQPGTLQAALAQLRQVGCLGVNVTVPLKEEAQSLAWTPTSRSKLAQAANTLWWDDDYRLYADNTDGVGLVADLVATQTLELRGSRILLLGAGGAAAGAIPALLDAGPRSLVVVNRNPTRAQALVRRFSTTTRIHDCPAQAPFTEPFDLIVNATSASIAGLAPEVGAGAIGPNSVCYDLYYSREETAFLRWARERGARVCRDGLGMLIEQAAAAFFRWHGCMPDTRSVFSALKK